MTLSRTFGSLHQEKVSKSTTVLFNHLGIYRFGLVIAALDIFDIYDGLESTSFIKYLYAAIVIGFMSVYFLRWKQVYLSIAPTIFLIFFVLTGTVFALRFFIYDERNSYISAFVSPLIFCATMFIPPNVIVLDARKLARDLAILFTAGTLFYLFEGIIKRQDLLSGVQSNIQLLKSMSCLLMLCLSILLGRKSLVVLAALLTVVALELRPASTLVLALVCCLPIAIALRLRVRRFRPIPVFVGRIIAMTTLALAASIPLLLYFFFDDVAGIISDWESYLKGELIGGVSNMAFRLAILKFAFTQIDNTSFWYGSALGGSLTVPLGQMWQWWFSNSATGEATIHSDFVLVLSLMGILGYVVFSAAFYFVLRDRFHELARRNLGQGGVIIQSISVIGCVALLVYCSDQPYLGYFSHTHVIWMLLLISEVARKSKVAG